MKSIIFSVVLLFSFCIFGNAEPIDILSSLKSTGNLVALEKTDIEIKKESLFIKINGVSADIEVNYIYFNKGKDETIDFAFPIDFEVDIFDARQDPMHKDITNFSILMNGAEAYPEYTIEKFYDCNPNEKSCHPIIPPEMSDYFIKRWYITKIQFPQNRETKVTVKYKVNAYAYHGRYSGDPIPVLGSRILRYDFSPAQYFGMGKADEIEIVIDAQKVDSIGGEIVKISPLVFKEKDKIYRYSGKNFDFRKNPSVSVEYDIKNSEMSDYFFQGHRWNNRSYVADVEASSSLPNHGAWNLFDKNPATAWCFKRSGKEEFVEFTLDDGYYKPVVFYISVMNGYLKNKVVYDANGKVAEFDITTVCDKPCACDTCKEMADKLKKDPSKNLKPKIPVWNERFKTDVFGETNTPIMEEGYINADGCKIKIIIKSTVKGEKSDDVCISEIFLM